MRPTSYKEGSVIHYTDSSRHLTTHTNLPIIGHGKEPSWFTRHVAVQTRLRELRTEEQIARLQGIDARPKPVLARVRSALGLA